MYLRAFAPWHGITCGLFCAAFYATVLLPLAAAEPSKLAATCYGAAGEVTGSLHVLDTGNGRWMIDCGSVIDDNDADQPVDETADNGQRQRNAPQTLPNGVESVSAAFISHAHADHLGRLPLLIERGFRGPIYMTEATAALAVPAIRVGLRRDQITVHSWTWSKERRARSEKTGKSLYVHWRDCKYRKEIDAQSGEQATCSFQKLLDRFANQVPQVHATLCSECISDQIAAILRNARTVKYGVATDVSPGVRVTFLDAGHIPGAASILFEVALGEKKHLSSPSGRGAGGEDGSETGRIENSVPMPDALTLTLSQGERGLFPTKAAKTRRVLFSGDLGNGLSPLLPAPRPAPEADAVFVEATYGPISRKASVIEQSQRFRRELGEAIGQGGVTWIPCFALDRTQKVFYELHRAQEEKLLPRSVPIYCPSPTAKEITALYNEHRRSWFSPAIADDANAFSPREIRVTVPSAKRLPRPCIIISTGDLLVSEWMRRLLSTLLPEKSTNIFLVAYQPAGAAGELLLHGAKTLDIEKKNVTVEAKIHSFSCFSGHADATEIDAWLANVSKRSVVILIHGDRTQLDARAQQLRDQGRQRVIVAKPAEAINLAP